MIPRLTAIACIVLTAPAFALPIFTPETFSSLSIPTGWTIQGDEGCTNSVPGTPKIAADYLGTGAGFGYLRLTEDLTYQRASAFYTAQTFRADAAWTLNWSVRIGKTHNGSETLNGADGFAVCLVDASTVNPADGLSELLGGPGAYLGAPRGNPYPGVLGRYAGLKGWSFVLDHSQGSGELSQEFAQMVNLSDSSHLTGSGHDFIPSTSFFYNDGWQDVRLAYDGASRFDFYWGPGLANSYHWTNLIAAGDYYLGFSAATATASAYHEVDNPSLYQTDIPEPSSAALFAGGALLLGLLRRRRAA